MFGLWLSNYSGRCFRIYEDIRIGFLDDIMYNGLDPLSIETVQDMKEYLERKGAGREAFEALTIASRIYTRFIRSR